jgi:hypothetical protein
MGCPQSAPYFDEGPEEWKVRIEEVNKSINAAVA